MTIINESGVYALIFGSKLESAKRFKHWITSEVLPTIRRTGCYGNTDAQRDVRMSAVIDKMLDIQKQQMDIIRSLIDADTSKDRDVYDKTQDVYNDTQESVGFYTGLPKEHMFTEYSSNIIRDLRKELGISQSELSRRSDIERGYIVHLERGRNRPSTPLFFKLIKAMGYIMVLLERDRIEGDEKWMMR